ncbi:KH domain-containing protein, partial [Desulfobulbus sp. N2]|nr:KH domain-containing protein [Desulfobulbus sp. N2]
YAANLYQDQQIRKYLKRKLYHAGIARIVIERTGDKVRVKLHTARPGIVIGKKGAEIESHVLVILSRRPMGLTFCPKVSLRFPIQLISKTQERPKIRPHQQPP